MSKYVYADDMAEISGFGGSYEAACRAMVIAGVEWFDAHPEAGPKFHGFEGVYGICMEDNDDARALTAAMMEAKVVMEDGRIVRCGDEATGAMHQAAVTHVLQVRKNGWEWYCGEMRKGDDAQ